jgi:hypothetical protein
VKATRYNNNYGYGRGRGRGRGRGHYHRQRLINICNYNGTILISLHRIRRNKKKRKICITERPRDRKYLL